MMLRDEMPLFRAVLGEDKPTKAVALNLEPCNVHRACELNELWHSRLPKIHWSNVVRNKNYCCYIFTHNDLAYASSIWSSPVARSFDAEITLELRRLAIAPDAPKNTASRMIGLMVKDVKKKMKDIKLLISYQDTEVHSGTIYKASNWTRACTNKGSKWNHKGRQRNKEQTLADKTRWEYAL
jgi:hypothetical protein